MAYYLINPGSGLVKCPGNTKRNARANAKALARDAGGEWTLKECKAGQFPDERGYYQFVFKQGRRRYEVGMPGLPRALVRYEGEPQNPFSFHRLYVDGNSWWVYAVSTLRRE
jgi:hypothetical protein